MQCSTYRQSLKASRFEGCIWPLVFRLPGLPGTSSRPAGFSWLRWSLETSWEVFRRGRLGRWRSPFGQGWCWTSHPRQSGSGRLPARSPERKKQQHWVFNIAHEVQLVYFLDFKTYFWMKQGKVGFFVFKALSDGSFGRSVGRRSQLVSGRSFCLDTLGWQEFWGSVWYIR